MIDTDKYEGHTPAPWQTNDCDSQGVWQEHDESIPRHIAMAHSDRNWEDMTEAEFNRMMADKFLIAAAPDLLAEVKRLREAFLIATGHVGYGNHLGHNELRHALNSVGIDADSLPWADGEWSEEQ